MLESRLCNFVLHQALHCGEVNDLQSPDTQCAAQQRLSCETAH